MIAYECIFFPPARPPGIFSFFFLPAGRNFLETRTHTHTHTCKKKTGGGAHHGQLLHIVARLYRSARTAGTHSEKSSLCAFVQ